MQVRTVWQARLRPNSGKGSGVIRKRTSPLFTMVNRMPLILLPGPWSWKSIAAWAVVVVLVAVTIMVYTAKQPASPPSWPQPGVVVSYYLTPMIGGAGGGGCTIGDVVATVRLNNGRIVRATSRYGVVHDGALVTVEKFKLLCGLADYTVLHGGPPSNLSANSK